MIHYPFLRRCLELAEHGRGKVGNGALVGTVLVRDGEIIAEGYHAGFGKPHAERALLELFTDHILPTDTLYVNLEPCCHTGKTPPCTDIIIERGIKNIVYGMRDPDTRVSGEGLKRLRVTGCSIVGPILPEESMWLNRGFVSVRTKNRPWITLKIAKTRDGKIANADGSTLKITSEDQDRWSHEFLRATHDAILIGIGSVITDNPNLNTRFVQDSPPLHRIILDPHLRIPHNAQVLETSSQSPTTVIVSPEVDPNRMKKISERGVRIVTISIEDHHFVWNDLWNALMTPDGDYHGITSLLVEGGATTAASFQSAGHVDCDVVLSG